MGTQLYGVYRARVVDVNDPMGKGRVRVCPTSGLGENMAVWAPVMMTLALKHIEVGDTVLVAFEEGKSLYPIVLGVMHKGSGKDELETGHPDASI